MQVPSHLDPTKMIDQYNQWAVTIVNTQNTTNRKKFFPSTSAWAGHAGIVIETLDIDGDYCAYFAHLYVSRKYNLPTVKILNTLTGRKIISIVTIDSFNHPKGKGETYLCEAEKVNRLIGAIEEEQKLCWHAIELIKKGVSPPKEIENHLEYPQFSRLGRYSFLIRKTIKIGDSHSSKKEASEAINEQLADLDLIKSKLSIVKKRGRYWVVKKPDNCLTWAKKMLVYYCRISIKKESSSVLFSAPSVHIEPKKKKVLNTLASVPSMIKSSPPVVVIRAVFEDLVYRPRSSTTNEESKSSATSVSYHCASEATEVENDIDIVEAASDEESSGSFASDVESYESSESRT